MLAPWCRRKRWRALRTPAAFRCCSTARRRGASRRRRPGYRLRFLCLYRHKLYARPASACCTGNTSTSTPCRRSTAARDDPRGVSRTASTYGEPPQNSKPARRRSCKRSGSALQSTMSLPSQGAHPRARGRLAALRPRPATRNQFAAHHRQHQKQSPIVSFEIKVPIRTTWRPSSTVPACGARRHPLRHAASGGFGVSATCRASLPCTIRARRSTALRRRW